MHRLTLTERMKLAVGAVLDEHADDTDHDPNIRAVRIEVRVKPDGEIRTVIVDRQSELTLRQ